MYNAIVGLLASLPRILDYIDRFVERTKQVRKEKSDAEQLEKDKPEMAKAIDEKDSESLNNILNS